MSAKFSNTMKLRKMAMVKVFIFFIDPRIGNETRDRIFFLKPNTIRFHFLYQILTGNKLMLVSKERSIFLNKKMSLMFRFE